MTDTRGREVTICDDRCGCPTPCPGGVACRCTMSSGYPGPTEGVTHRTCSCGKHCSCNPCPACGASVTATGRGACRCGAGCTCVDCAA